MQEAILVGRLTKEAEFKGKTATATLACQRPFPFNKNKDGDEITDFFAIKFIGEKNAERAEKYLHKGVKIIMRGIPCRDTWKDDDGWKEYNYFIVQDWEFAESKKTAQENSSNDNGSSATSKDDFMEVDNTDDSSGIPFL
jgi:single-strand DNA-binding protein